MHGTPIWPPDYLNDATGAIIAGRPRVDGRTEGLRQVSPLDDGRFAAIVDIAEVRHDINFNKNFAVTVIMNVQGVHPQFQKSKQTYSRFRYSLSAALTLRSRLSFRLLARTPLIIRKSVIMQRTHEQETCKNCRQTDMFAVNTERCCTAYISERLQYIAVFLTKELRRVMLDLTPVDVVLDADVSL